MQCFHGHVDHTNFEVFGRTCSADDCSIASLIKQERRMQVVRKSKVLFGNYVVEINKGDTSRYAGRLALLEEIVGGYNCRLTLPSELRDGKRLAFCRWLPYWVYLPSLTFRVRLDTAEEVSEFLMNGVI